MSPAPPLGVSPRGGRGPEGAGFVAGSVPGSVAMALESLRYRRGSLEVLNQRLLPGQLRYERVGGVERAWGAIRDMEVRGDPPSAP